MNGHSRHRWEIHDVNDCSRRPPIVWVPATGTRHIERFKPRLECFSDETFHDQVVANRLDHRSLPEGTSVSSKLEPFVVLVMVSFAGDRYARLQSP